LVSDIICTNNQTGATNTAENLAAKFPRLYILILSNIY